jgi:hypothetical protein
MNRSLRAAGTAGLLCLIAVSTAAAQENWFTSYGDGGFTWFDEFDSGPQPWTAQVGALFLWRSNPDAGAAVVPLAGPGVIANASDYQFGGEAGVDFTLRRHLFDYHGIEVRYFGQTEWDAAAAYGAVGNVQIGSFNNFGATNLDGSYESSLENVEINWLYDASDRVTLLGGFRSVEVDDAMNFDITFPAFTARYRWDESNRLYGAQGGAYIKLCDLEGPFQIIAAMKAGVYGNTADNEFTLRPSTGGLFTGGGDDTDVSFVGDISLVGTYKLTDHIALRGGYQLIWIDGIAIASEQVINATANSTQAGIDLSGDVFYHGALTGLEITW